jgi:hypothetical protein
MELLRFFQWVQDSAVGTEIRESVLFFPIVESIHVLALTVSVGLILITDLRLIGWRFQTEVANEIMGQLRPWMLAGFAAMFLTGGLLFWAEAANCYQSPTFRIKLLFLLGAGLNAACFETTSGRSPGAWSRMNPPPRAVRAAGWLSLFLWAGVIVFGRWTAYGLS